MKNIFNNVTKNLITSIIGTAVMVLTVIMIWTGVMSFQWEGVLGLSIGTILLFAPKSIEKLADKAIGRVSGKSSSEEPNDV